MFAFQVAIVHCMESVCDSFNLYNFVFSFFLLPIAKCQSPCDQMGDPTCSLLHCHPPQHDNNKTKKTKNNNNNDNNNNPNPFKIG